ncbi:MAG: hypothetical protein ACREQ5_08050 [Candidatus Dormibacteria bacterium]
MGLLGKPLPQRLFGTPDIYAASRNAIFHCKPASYRGKAVIILGKGTWTFAGLSSSIDPWLAWRQHCLGGREVHRPPAANWQSPPRFLGSALSSMPSPAGEAESRCDLRGISLIIGD